MARKGGVRFAFGLSDLRCDGNGIDTQFLCCRGGDAICGIIEGKRAVMRDETRENPIHQVDIRRPRVGILDGKLNVCKIGPSLQQGLQY